MYIAVAGNIGSGKTTLTTLLAEHFGWQPEFESTEANPYLEDFYQEMERWSFHLQVQFLQNSFRQVNDLGERKVVQDRSFYENAHIFARNLHRSGLMNERDFENYWTLFRLMLEHVRQPDLLIYLKADVERLQQQIEKRGRSYEKNIPLEYLSNLNGLYNEWIAEHTESKLLVVDMNDRDFVENPSDFSHILQAVRRKLEL